MTATDTQTAVTAHLAGILTKAEFAAAIGVSAGRVSQYIADGRLDGEALVGEGRTQRINLAIATAQLRSRLDIAQMRGNGKMTRIFRSEAPLTISETFMVELGTAFADHFHLRKREVLRFLGKKIIQLAQRAAGSESKGPP